MESTASEIMQEYSRLMKNAIRGIPVHKATARKLTQEIIQWIMDKWHENNGLWNMEDLNTLEKTPYETEIEVEDAKGTITKVYVTARHMVETHREGDWERINSKTATLRVLFSLPEAVQEIEDTNIIYKTKKRPSGWHRIRWGEDNKGIPLEELNAIKKVLEDKIYETIIHELTHVSDTFEQVIPSGQMAEEEDKFKRDLSEEEENMIYHSSPQEAEAFAHEIIDDISRADLQRTQQGQLPLDDFWQALAQSNRWQYVSQYLNDWAREFTIKVIYHWFSVDRTREHHLLPEEKRYEHIPAPIKSY